jgi:RimJ/RimL family protein N-acetyltransferase
VQTDAAVHTERLRLRSWRSSDAAALLPILEANTLHLSWIPQRVAAPAPAAELALRLQRFADDFDAARNWRYALFTRDGRELLGELSLFPRNADGRVPFDAADCIEIGYWLRSDFTGRGYITEAVRAALAMIEKMPHIRSVEIRCDVRNAPSAAIPRRLGFTLDRTIAEDPHSSEPPRLMVWKMIANGDGRY